MPKEQTFRKMSRKTVTFSLARAMTESQKPSQKLTKYCGRRGG